MATQRFWFRNKSGVIPKYGSFPISWEGYVAYGVFLILFVGVVWWMLTGSRSSGALLLATICLLLLIGLMNILIILKNETTPFSSFWRKK